MLTPGDAVLPKTPEPGPAWAVAPRPLLAVDLVIFTLLDADLKVLLVRRAEPPFAGQLALPGGFVRVGQSAADQGESLDQAAARELAEETGLLAEAMFLEQLYTFGDAGRDPRGRVVSVSYFALVRPTLAPLVRPGGDAAAAGWHSLSAICDTPLAFDHRRIVDTALARIRGKIDYSDIAFALVGETFSVAELRAVHEVVKGTTYDPANFRRRLLRMQQDGIIERAPGKRLTGARSAAVFRFRGGR